LNELTAQEEIFFYRLIVTCDDYGITDARLKLLRSKCFPLKTDSIKENDIEKWLNGLIKAGLCFLYEVNGKRYLKMTSWDRHQQIRAQKSKFPLPDCDGFQMISIDSESNPNMSIENLFNIWNEQKIMVHQKITPDIEKSLSKALKQNTEEEIRNSILRYSKMINDKSYTICDYKWSLVNFLSREKGYRLFLDDGEKWVNYLDRDKPKPQFKSKYQNKDGLSPAAILNGGGDKFFDG